MEVINARITGSMSAVPADTKIELLDLPPFQFRLKAIPPVPELDPELDPPPPPPQANREMASKIDNMIFTMKAGHLLTRVVTVLTISFP